MEPPINRTSPAVPIAIICGFGLIALAIFFTGGSNADQKLTAQKEPAKEETTGTNAFRPVDETDHILGNPNAPIMMVEYSDYDCPFCKRFHATMNQIMEDYGVTGQVAWVYRQLPLPNLHPNSAKIAETALCVGDIGGDEAFWKFSNAVYEGRDATDLTNVAALPDYVTEAGVDLTEQEACMKSGKVKARLESDMKDSVSLGITGTPYTIIMVGNQQAIINGSKDYAVIKGILDNLLAQLDGSFDPEASTTPEVPTNSNGVPILE